MERARSLSLTVKYVQGATSSKSLEKTARSLFTYYREGIMLQTNEQSHLLTLHIDTSTTMRVSSEPSAGGRLLLAYRDGTQRGGIKGTSLCGLDNIHCVRFIIFAAACPMSLAW